MTPKHYFAAIIIIALIFLSGFSGKAQNSSDTIRIVKSGLGYLYYQDDVTLNFKQVMALTKENKKACRLMEQATNMRGAAYVFAAFGGGFAGYALGYALGCAMYGNPMNQPLFFIMLGAGAAFIGIGVAFEAGANNKVKAGVELFNQSKKQTNNPNLGLNFSPNGVNLRLNF